MNHYANEYELETICKLFPALKPSEALEGDDTFFTKHLIANLEKCTFEKNYQELKRKQKK